MQSIIGGWLRSYFKLGIPLFPVSDQSWLREKLPHVQAEFVYSVSRWTSLGHLYAVPKTLEGEFLRRARKVRVGLNTVKTIGSLVGILLLTEGNAPLAAAVMGFLFFMGIFGPIFVFGYRFRKFIQSQMIRVHPNASFAWEFRLIYWSIALLLFIYGFLQGAVDLIFEKEGGGGASEIAGSAEDVIGEILASPSSPVLAFLKAVGGLLIIGSSAFISWWALHWLSDYDKHGGFLLLVLFLVLIGSFGWSYWYYIRSEQRKT